jgi:CheY-like chemotaxis protein
MDRRYSVLIADQNTGALGEVRQALEAEGYDIIPAESGRDAIRIIHAELIHVLVMDVQLPDYTGFETYHAIQGIRDRFLPCIFTAMEVSTGSIRDALGEGAVTILPKPIEKPRLLRAVARSIHRYYPSRTAPRTGRISGLGSSREGGLL